MKTVKRVLVVMNPNAGQKRGKKYLADILEIFRTSEYVTTVMLTACQGDAMSLVKQHGQGMDLIVCIGGDGTFNEVVNGVLEAQLSVPIGYIPAGSTNDFANSLKLPKNMVKAAKQIVEGTAHTIDVGRFDDRYFSYVASFGAFTKVSYATPQNVKNTLGHLAYILEGVKDIPSIRPLHLRFETSDEVIEGDYLFGAISNSTSVGGILTLNPDVVDMNDGKFELLLIKAPNTIAELNDIIVALTTQNYDFPSITFATASEMTVYASPDMDWTLDGEREAGKDKMRVCNLHSAIQLIM